MQQQSGWRCEKPCEGESQGEMNGALKGIRIPVAALKGRCPRPLDDEGTGDKCSRPRIARQRV
jgi:hypothetical protein